MAQSVLLENCFSINAFTWTVTLDGVLFSTGEGAYYQNHIMKLQAHFPSYEKSNLIWKCINIILEEGI